MEKKNGVIETHYGNGQLQSRATYKNEKLNGLFEDWHENGNLKLHKLTGGLSRSNYKQYPTCI